MGVVSRRRLRSALFVPGDRPDRFDKAWASPADDVIIDLEDAVTPAQKAEARNRIVSWLSADRPVVIRVNAADTSWYADDVELIRHPGVRGLMVPKAEQVDETLASLCTTFDKSLLLIVETALGFSRVDALAAAPNVERLVFGTLDFQVDTGITGDDDALAYFRSRIVLASRVAGIQPPLDGVTVAVDDATTLRSDTGRSKRFGFGGKLCIHPRQVEIVNEVFSPSAAEIRWAHAVLEALAASSGGAVALDGKMVDRPVILKAEAILASSAPDSGRVR